MIIVTGATGKLGHGIVEQLLERLPASEIGVSVRDPAKAQALVERGVRVRRGDYADAASLQDAFEGATQVLLVSSNATDGTTLQQHRTAIEAAKATGARRIVYTSHMGANPDSAFPPMLNHAATETMLQECGVAFTSLRNGFYADTISFMIGNALDSGTIVAPEDGPVSWTNHADLAEVAAIALTEEERLDSVTPPLSASEALDLADIAAILSELTGRSITRVTVTNEEFLSSLVSRGLPESRAKMLIGMYVASRRGEFATVDPTLERLLGKSAITVRTLLASHIASKNSA